MFMRNGTPGIILTEEQCQFMEKILRQGLQVFEYCHDFDLHAEEIPFKKKPVTLMTFMGIFGNITNQSNFKDIMEPSMDLIFKYLLKYTKQCYG